MAEPREPDRQSRPGGRFRRGGRFGGGVEDPLSGVANLTDLMLVFACGLIVALVLAGDSSGTAEAEDPADAPRLLDLERAEEVESVERRPEERDDFRTAPGRYRSMGTVYRDTTTGRLFVVDEGG